MISTRFQEELVKKLGNEDVIELRRPIGVADTFEIPVSLIASNVVGVSLAVDAVTRRLKAVSDSNHVLVITDEIGVKGDCQVVIHPISYKCFAVELLSGSLFLHNGSGVPYGFNVDKKLITNFDPAHVNWLSVEKVYDAIKVFLGFRAASATQETLEKYLFNASYAVNLGYKSYTGTKPTAGTCYSSTSYSIRGVDTTMAFGEIAIDLNAPAPAPAPKSRRDKKAAVVEEESTEELLGMSDDDDEEEDYNSYNEMPRTDMTDDEENYEIDTSGGEAAESADDDLYDENEEDVDEDE